MRVGQPKKFRGEFIQGNGAKFQFKCASQGPGQRWKLSENKMKADWVVYILRTAGDRLYTGITTDLQRRLAEHGGTGKGRGAKSLRGKGPLEVVCQFPAADRGEALRLEARIKKLKRTEKDQLVEGAQEVALKIREGL